MSNKSFIEKLLDGVEVEWKILGEVAEIKRGTSITKKNVTQGEIPVIAGGRTPAYFHNLSNRTGQTIVIAGSGAYAGFLSWWEQPIFVSDAFTVKPQGEVLNKYCYYWLQGKQQQLHEMQSGGGVPHVYPRNVAPLQIPIPCPDNPKKSLEIQAEIVRILDAFTALTAELTTELTARKKQYNYYRDQLLSFPRPRVGMHTEAKTNTQESSHAGAWEPDCVEWKTLGEITRVSSASRVHKNEWTTSGVPFFRTSDVISIFNGVKNSRDDAFISNELYETLSSKSGKTQKNDILVTGGGTIGIPYIVPTDEPLYFKDADLLCIKKSKTLNSKFLYHYFLTTKFRIYLRNISHNSTIAHYTISQIKKTPVPIPPLEEQIRIVAILDKFDTLTTSISEGLPREIELRHKQYEYYRDLLLSFPKKTA